MIYVDDLSSDWDLPRVMTPSMHALAQRGVRFSRAYAGHAVCSPSRAFARSRALGLFLSD